LTLSIVPAAEILPKVADSVRATPSSSPLTALCSREIVWLASRWVVGIAEGGGLTMSFRLEGTYVENCNCDVICPCTWSSLARAATNDRCMVVLVMHVERGDIDGVDVSGLSMGFIADTPPVMSEGGWRLGVVLDGAADPAQLDRMRRFMGGEFGGVPAALGPLVGEMIGEVVEAIEFRDEDGQHILRIGSGVNVTVADVTSPGLGAAQLANVGHPVNTTLTIGEGVGSHISLLGIEYSGAGKAGFSAPFSWAA